MDEFLIELQAKLDEAKSKGNINSDIGSLQGQIDKLKIQAEIDPKTAQKLASDIEKLVNQKTTISNIEVDTKSGTKAGQNYGKQFSKGIAEGLKDNEAILNTFKKSLENMGMGSKEIDKVAERVKNLNLQIDSLTQSISSKKGKESGKDILSVGITGTDQMGQAIKLTEQYDKANGELLKSIDSVTAAQKKADNTSENFIKKQKRMLSNKQNTINQITSNAFDKNASSPITSEESLDKLNAQADKIRTAMDSLRNSTEETFDDAVLKVNEEISSFKILEKELRRADNVFDKMKGTDTSSDISIAKNRLEKFKYDAKEFPQIKKTIEDLDAAFSNVGDAESLNKFNDQLKVAKAELERVKTETSVTLKELEKSYQHINDLQIKKNTLDATADKNKISNLNDEILKAQNKYNDIFDSASRSNNFDIGKWEEKKKAIDSATKSKLEYNNANSTDSLENTKNGLASTLSNLKSSLQENGLYTDELKEKIKSLKTELSNVSNQIDLSAFKSSLKDVSTEAEKMVSNADQAKKIHEAIENKSIDKNVSDITKQFRQIPNVTDSIKSDFNEIIKLHEELSKPQTNEKLIQNYNKLNETLLKVKNTMGILKNESKDMSEPIDILASQKKINGLANRVLSFKENNSAMSHSLSNSLDEMYKHLISGAKITQKEFDNLESKFSNIKLETRESGKMGKSFIGRLKDDISNFMSWGFATGLAGQGIQTARKMVSEVYNVDTAMTNLYKVTDETKNKYNEFLTSSSSNAQELGRTVSSLVEQSANWAKLGYTIDESKTLSKTSSIYANVGEIDDNTAVADIVTAMKAYNIKAEEAIKIVDSYNKLGNEFATDAKSLGDGISNAASSLATAGNDMDQSLGMLTGMTEIMQNASEAGNALKILSMRLRGYDEETESYTNDIEILTGNIADLTKTAKTPGGISIFSDKDKQTYKSTYQIMKEVSEIWDDLTDKNRAQLTEVLAGKQRGNAISALIQAFQSGQVEKAFNASKNAAGSAMQEQERWMESLEAKTQQFQAAFQTLSNTVINSDLLKFFVDLGTGAVNVLDGIIGKFNNISALATGGNSIFGTIGALSGLLMNVKGIGERFAFQW